MKHAVEISVKLLEFQREYRDKLKSIDFNSKSDFQKLHQLEDKINLLNWVLNLK